MLAQRLVRVICDRCKEKYTPSMDILKDLGFKEKEKLTLYRGIGCAKCNYLGFSGRTAIYELLIVDDDIRKLVVEKASSDKVRKVAVEKGMHTLMDDAMDKIKKSVTTPEEVLRVMQTI